MAALGRKLIAKIVAGIVMIWVVATFTFFLVRLMPGDPVSAQYNQDIIHGMTPVQAQDAVSVMYGFIPRQPLPAQYGQYLWQLLHFNLGKSITYEGVPVAHIISAAIPWTVIAALTGIVLSFVIGVSLGVLGAIRRSTKTGTALTIFSAVVNGLPVFLVAILLFYVFTTIWAVLPSGGNYSITATPGWNLSFIGSVITHAILPVTAYALAGFGGYVLTMKSSVISVLGDDFILAAELRGLRPLTVARYIGRNAILPLFTILAISIGLMFGGAVYVEDVFNYPGLGQLLLNAVDKSDYPLMSGVFLMIIAAVIVCNILADLLYVVIDPRIRRA